MSYVNINENYFYINDRINESIEEAMILEGANFDIMPKFNTMCGKYPELRKHENLIKECNELLKDNDMNPQKAKRTSQTILRVFRFFLNIVNTFFMSSLILLLILLLFPIVSLLLNRLLVWGIESGDLSIVKSTNDKALDELEELKGKTKDPEVKKKCDEMINKIEENNKKLR